MPTETFSLARIIAPTPTRKPDSPEVLGETLKSLLGHAEFYLDQHLIPNPPETYNQPWTQLCYIHLRKLRSHIRRVEHALRCFILFLATQILNTEAGRARAAELLNQPPREKPRKRPYDPLILMQEKRPARSSFSAIAGLPARTSRKSGHCHFFEPLDWKEVDGARDINRLKTLASAISQTERHALRLAARLLAGEFYTSTEAATAPRITLPGYLPDKPTRRSGPHLPSLFTRLENWYPPDDLLIHAEEDARSDLTQLHLIGCRALSACADL